MFSTIVWPNEFVTGCVTIYHELNLVLVGSDEISDCSRFWFGECSVTWPVIGTQFSAVFSLTCFPVNSIITIEINSRVLVSAGTDIIWVGILSLIYNFSVREPMLFYQSSSINIDYWQEEKLCSSKNVDVSILLV
jgi:hypothetical protein